VPLLQLLPLLRMMLLLLLALSILRILLHWSPKRRFMHDLVLRSSLFYVYRMIYERLVWGYDGGYDGVNMGILVGVVG
jgi:hypothetical protein